MRRETYSERVERERRDYDSERGPRHERYEEKLERYRREWRKEIDDQQSTEVRV